MQTNLASPTQLASNSDLMGVSDASNSPQTPQTSQHYGRMRPRYPQELGRVPLHRRGTSRTYERLEDLLKEAGYKETRIFTPETERTGKCEDDDDDATVVGDKRTSMVKDVVGFLAGLIPGVGASTQSVGGKVLDQSTGPQARGTNNSLFPSQRPSPPFSSLADKAAFPPPSRHDHHVDPHPTQSDRPQIVIHPTTPHHNRVPGQQSYPHHYLHQHEHHPAHQESRHGSGSISGSNIAPLHLTTNAHSPRPSRATAYLRHMASAPNVKRPNSTSAGHSHSHRSSSGLGVPLTEGDSHETSTPQIGDRGSYGQPPLPTSWLETVTKAVLFGGAGARVGGPMGSHQVRNTDSNPHERRASPVRQLRPSRSSLSQVSHNSRYYSHNQHRSKKSMFSTDRGGLSDSTNFTPSTATSSVFLSPGPPPNMPPALFGQIERGRADRCVSEVSLARVMCRSAPGSRSGSVVRSEGVDKNKRNLDVEVDGRQARGRNRGVKRRGGAGDKEKLRVPSLARMHVEGDAWSSNMKTRKRSRPEPGSGFGKGKVGYASEGEFPGYESYSDESEEDEDEEEGEVNLASMLLPPKSQNSIRSLRKHLFAAVGDAGSGGHSKLRRAHLASGRKGGEGGKAVDGRLRRQTSCVANFAGTGTDEEREDDRVFWQDSHRNTAVPSPNLNVQNFRQIPNPAPLSRLIPEDRKGNCCSDGEDVGGKEGFVRDPLGSGKSSTRLGIVSAGGVMGGRGAE